MCGEKENNGKGSAVYIVNTRDEMAQVKWDEVRLIFRCVVSPISVRVPMLSSLAV